MINMINRLVKKSWMPLVLRILALLGFIFILFVLYFGSVKLIFNFTNTWIIFILWTLWWPFLYISLLLLGRFWCGFICPVGLTNEMGNTLRETKKNYLAKYAWLPFVVLFLIVFWEQVSGLFFSTNLTFLFLITFLVSGLLVGMILPRWGFCKYFCPLGTLLGVFSRLSILGLRTNKKICEECKTKECIKGGKVAPCPLFNYVPGIKSNQNCLLCTNCIKNCPHNSAKLCFVKPGEEIKRKAGFNLAESLFIVALLALGVILTSRGTKIGRFFPIPDILLRAWDFIFWIGLFMLLYFLISYISTKLKKPEKRDFKENQRFSLIRHQNKVERSQFKEDLIKGGYVFLPLAFSLMFFLIVFGFITPLTNIKESWIAMSKYILLLIGAVWSIKLSLHLFKKRAWIYILSIVLLVGFWIFIIIPGPLNTFPEDPNIYFVEDGEIINMEGSGMSFDPSIIMAKTGDSFTINITNSDIAHSFDIDELDIHMSSKQGGNLKINLRNLEQGEYEYYCAIPGHRDAGMKGKLIVE